MSIRNRIATALAIAILLPAALPLVPTAAAASVSGGGSGAPSFTAYPAPANLGPDAGEVTLGVNPNTGAVLMTTRNLVPLNIPPSMKVASINFDNSQSPPTATWIDATNASPGSHGNIDPILFTDRVTGRTWAGGLDGACSVLGMTDNDGATWSPVGNACVATLDHETIGSGPYAEPLPVDVGYERVVYYCAQANAVTCVTSYDGGLTFPVASDVACEYLNPGFHGSVEVAPNGWAWLPFGQITDHVCLAVSKDNGVSWTDIVLEPTTPSAGFDPDVATTPFSWVYVGYSDANGRAHVALSQNGGSTWSYSPDLGAPFGVQTTTFHEMVAGDDQRAAIAFLGTTMCCVGDAFSNHNWPAVWHLYVSYTYDAGQTWTTVRASDDPIQRGCIWDGGGNDPCRNLLDFMDAQVDNEGRVVVGLSDGCRGACAEPSGTTSQSTDSWGTVVLQTSGRSLYAAKDSASVVLAGPITGSAGSATAISADVTASMPYTANVRWGDGSPVEAFTGLTSPTFTASHVYAAAGTYDILLPFPCSSAVRASDTGSAAISEGGSGGATVTITAPAEGEQVGGLVRVEGILATSGNAAPVAAFSFVASGASVAFDATASSDADGDALSYAWTFGDGGVATGATPTHAYGSPGTYQACLTVSDGALSANVCHDVVIQPTQSGSTVIATDPEGDATIAGQAATYMADLDILKLTATQTLAGEPQFTVQVKSLGQPAPHLDRGSTSSVWRVAWTGPSGKDYVEFAAGPTMTACNWGTITTTASPQGSATCGIVQGSPGTLTLTFPASAMAARGYATGIELRDLVAQTNIFYGTPPETGRSGANVVADTTTASSYTLAANVASARIGVPLHAAAQPAPASPPANAQVTDKVDDGPFEQIDHLNVTAAWFDADADYLYIGMHVKDVPATSQATAHVNYKVAFTPTWAVEDATWDGAVPSGNTFTNLEATALFSPAGLDNTGLPKTSTATVFTLNAISTGAVGNNFGVVAQVDGSISAESDILWWQIPRAVLQSPPGGSTLVTPNAATEPAIEGLVTFGLGDVTGDGEDFAFPGAPASAPVVTLSGTPTSGVAPLEVAFAATSDPASVATWSMSFGDASATQSGAGAVPTSFSHVYDAPGDYTATLTASTVDGTGTASVVVHVGTSGGAPLRVLVSADGLPAVTATCTAGCATWFADLDVSSLPDGAVTITAVLSDATSSDAVTVTKAGGAPAGLVITSPGEGDVVPSTSLTVSGTLGRITDAAPTATIAADRAQGVAPLAVTFTLGGGDNEGVLGWRFTSGDGRVVDGTDALPVTIQHTYASVGSYVATFTVTDTAGQTDTSATGIQAQATNTPPTAPHSPAPADGATGVPLVAALGWSAEDADGNALTYDVYLDNADASTLVATGQGAGYLPASLQPGTTYAWRVVAHDGTDATSGPVWTFTTSAAALTEAQKPHVVVAVIDTGGNPYHQQFRRPDLKDDPSTYISGLSSAQLQEVDLCFWDNATKTATRTCPTSFTAAYQADAAQWSRFGVTPLGQTGAGQGEIAWFPGTNMMTLSFAHDNANTPVGVDGGAGTMDSHGTWTSSNVGGLTTGTCPECTVVLIEVDSVDAISAAYRWAANQPWIDVITSSTSVGLIGTGWNPADFFDVNSQAAKTAVTNGKLMFESSGNGLANFGLVPTSTYLYGNSNPWTIAVGCSAEHTGQMCGYSDWPNAITASGDSRISANPASFTSTSGVGGTSFSSPSAAGVAARTIFALRSQFGDVAEGPSATAGKSLLRIPAAARPASGPMADGNLTRLELEEALFKTARRDTIPEFPTYLTPNSEVPNTPLNFLKEGYGDVYEGDWGVGYAGALATWSSSADAAQVLLGAKDVPNRFVEEFYWEQVVTPSQEFIHGSEVPDSDADAFPVDGEPDPTSLLVGYAPQAAVSAKLPALRAAIADGEPLSADATRLYLHHADLGPDPSSVNGNHLYDKYLNTVATPSDADDASGIGATGVSTAGFSTTYTVAHPTLGGVVLLDTTKDVVVHVAATDYAGGPATVTQMTATLTSEGGAVVGSASGAIVPGPTAATYEIRFKPALAALADPVELKIAWAGPAYSSHIMTQGASWIDLPVAASLPPVETRAIRYFADDADADFVGNGATLALTRDASALANDPDIGSGTLVPTVNGYTMNLVASDALVTGSSMLTPAGSLTVYVCPFPVIDLGAAPLTVDVGLAVGGTPVGGGTLSTTLVAPAELPAALVVPLALKTARVPTGEPLSATIRLLTAGGVATPNVAFCGGSAERPITIDLSVQDLAPVLGATLDATPDTLSGSVTLAGDAWANPPSLARQQVWYAKDMGDWSGSDNEFALATDGPGTAAQIPILPPDPAGTTIVLRSAPPLAAELGADAFPDGVGRVEYWVTGNGGAANVQVDVSVVVDGSSGQRLLGAGSLTRHVAPPTVADADPADPFWQERFVVPFDVAALAIQPDDALVVTITTHDAGPAGSGHSACGCGDAARPVLVALPATSPAPAGPTQVDIDLGAIHRTVTATDGAWSATVDTRTLANGAHALSVTPRTTIAGVEYSGVAVTRAVSVQNTQLNTAPSATLTLSPTTGVAPLAVTATLGGADAQTPAALLTWTMDWGDGSPVETGTGLPATRGHVYAAGVHAAQLTVSDAGGMLASAGATANVANVAEPRQVFVALDGGQEAVAVDDAGDGSFATWHLDLAGLEEGPHTIAARYGTASGTLSSASVGFGVRLPNHPTVAIVGPADGAAVASDGALTGTVTLDDPNAVVDEVRVSLDAAFASYASATSADGFASWSLPLSALALAEDVETTVYVRAISGAAKDTVATTLTLDQAPNARILVPTTLPVPTGADVQLEASGTPAATGSPFASYAWDLGDGATSTATSVSHAYARSGTYTVTLAVTDEAGEVGTTTRSVLVLNRLPTATIVAAPDMPTDLDTVTIDVTGAADPDGSVVDVRTLAYGGPARDAPVLATGGASLSLQYPDDGDYLVVAQVQDDEGGVGEVETLLHIANVRPVAALVAPAIVGAGVEFTLDASGSSDPDGSVVEYRFDPGDGTPIVVLATPQVSHSYESSGTYLARVTVVDDDGSAIASEPATIVANAAPVLGAIGNRAVQEGEPLAFTLSATDAENDALTYGVDALPAGAALDAQTGAFSWTPDFGQEGNYPVTFTVSDGYQQDAERVILSVGNVDLPPTLDAIGDKAGTENALLAFSVHGSDPDTPALTYGATGLPAGATFDGATGAFAWTPSFSQAGAYPVTFSATDGTTTVSEAITITIANVDRAPVLAAVPAKSVTQLDALSMPITATDADGDAIALTILNPLAGMRIVDDQHGHGTLQWTPTTAFVGAYPVTIVATSGTSSASQDTVITVVFRAGVTIANAAGDMIHTAPSRVVEVQTIVRNTGPNTDTFALSATNTAGWVASGLPATVTLAPGAETTVSVNVSVPATGTATFVSTKAVSVNNPLASKSVNTRIDLPVTIEIALEEVANGVQTGVGTVTVRYLDGAAAPNVAISITQQWRAVAPPTKTTITGASNATGVFAFDFSGDPKALLPGVHDLIVSARNGAAPEARAASSYRVVA